MLIPFPKGAALGTRREPFAKKIPASPKFFGIGIYIIGLIRFFSWYRAGLYSFCAPGDGNKKSPIVPLGAQRRMIAVPLCFLTHWSVTWITRKRIHIFAPAKIFPVSTHGRTTVAISKIASSLWRSLSGETSAPNLPDHSHCYYYMG